MIIRRDAGYIRFFVTWHITAGNIEILSPIIKVTKISMRKKCQKKFWLIKCPDDTYAATIVSGGITTPCFITAFLSIMAPGPITAPFSMTAPPPM